MTSASQIRSMTIEINEFCDELAKNQMSDLNCFVSAPGGIILQEGENASRTNTCLFGLADSMEKVKAFEQVFVKLMRR